eukprot:TRINITY_DN273_c0_g1_i1.p1 TRINITY_DN273_c0_g1~~TRINITY_DN273_c0_g1_i1.p1  ORF type:complete len:232 (+),score=45.59 TRINITY_DN273_c0_g1_i1:99-794(+)
MAQKVLITLSVLLAVAFAVGDAPLKIDIYIESLCPDCQLFIGTSLRNALKAQNLLSMVNVTLIPYGNAHETSSSQGWVFTCQHGSKECYGNIIETCAIDQLDQHRALLFITCLESAVAETGSFDTAGQQCAQQVNADFTAIKYCATSSKGNQLEHQMAQQTEALNPPHQYVPWVVVNGKHDVDAENAVLDNLLEYACKHSTVQIPECLNAAENTFPRKWSRCYKKEIMAFQ